MKVAERSDSCCFPAELIVDSIINIIIITPLLSMLNSWKTRTGTVPITETSAGRRRLLRLNISEPAPAVPPGALRSGQEGDLRSTSTEPIRKSIPDVGGSGAGTPGESQRQGRELNCTVGPD